MAVSTLQAINLSRILELIMLLVMFHLVLKREVLGFLGLTSWKSTTMRMLTGNLAPSDGSVKICGIDMVNEPKKAKEMIGYCLK